MNINQKKSKQVLLDCRIAFDLAKLITQLSQHKLLNMSRINLA